jgi:hypothetical protein
MVETAKNAKDAKEFLAVFAFLDVLGNLAVQIVMIFKPVASAWNLKWI